MSSYTDFNSTNYLEEPVNPNSLPPTIPFVSPHDSNTNEEARGPLENPSIINSQQSNNNLESFTSLNSLSNVSSTYPCRICRCEEEKAVRCPCKCKGSVGFVHLSCLKQWILHRRASRCEICKSHYTLPEEDFSFASMFWGFFTFRCFGVILKHLLLAISIVPLARIVLNQVFVLLDRVRPEEHEELRLLDLLLATFALLTACALFFNVFEFITQRLLIIRHILQQWWVFNDFETLNPETISLSL